VADLVEAICHKPECRAFDFRGGRLDFLLTILPPQYGPAVDSASNINEFIKYLLGAKTAGA